MNSIVEGKKAIVDLIAAIKAAIAAGERLGLALVRDIDERQLAAMQGVVGREPGTSVVEQK